MSISMSVGLRLCLPLFVRPSLGLELAAWNLTRKPTITLNILKEERRGVRRVATGR